MSFLNIENYAVPYTLPSKGKVYEDKIPGGELFILPMTVQQEKSLATARSANNPTETIDMLIQACTRIKDPMGKLIPLDMNPNDLLVDDRAFLLLCIRCASYGNVYEWQAPCPECRKVFTSTTTIPDDLEFKQLPDDFEEPFEVLLPMSKVKVYLRLLRGVDEKDIARHGKQVKHQVNVDNAGYTYAIAKQIVKLVAPDGKSYETKDVSGRAEISAFSEELLARDSLVLQQAADDHGCGSSMKISAFCDNCGREVLTVMPFTETFFRPRARA